MNRRNFIKLGGVAMASMLACRRSAVGQSESGHQFYETIIVGTGYGAAVAALRLAKLGIRSVMLEMGQDWSSRHESFSKMLAPKKESTWLKTKTIAPFGNIFGVEKYTGVLDRVDFGNVNVYMGRGVGGGSLVNGGMAVVPQRAYFETIFPFLDSQLFYEKYFPLAQKTLRVNQIDQGFYDSTPYYRFSRKGAAQAEKAGYETSFVPNVYDFDYMRREAAGEVARSGLGGEVIYGNRYGKNSLDKTYLKEALATGMVKILSLHKVEAIGQGRSGQHELAVVQTNEQGETIRNKFLSCKNLFICAGSVGTSSLLVKAKADGALPGLNESIGKNWGNNGNVMTGRNFIKGGTGAKQSSIPVTGIDNWSDPANSFFAEISPMPIGIETWTTLYLVITKLKETGNFYLDETTGGVKLFWNSAHSEQSVDVTKRFLDRMGSENGGTRARLLFENGIGSNICYHPLGGCSLGEATDKFGRVRGLQNLYVIDGSLIPGTIGVNPFLTITALAEYCLDNIIREDFGERAA